MTIKQYYLKMGGVEYDIHEFSLKSEGNSSVDTVELKMSRTQDSIFDIGDDVSLGYHNDSDVFVAEFNGDITSKESHMELSLVIESYGGRINRTEYVTEIHEDKTLEFIVESIITNYTSLTYASTATTGITLDRFVINNETVGEAITRILKDLDWQIRTDNDKNFYFEPKGETASSVVLTVGTNAFMQSNWQKNPSRLTNSCTVVGDKARFNTNQTFSPAVDVTTFTVTYKIVGNVRVTVDATEKTGGETGAIGTFDYSIDREQKKIIFESAMAGTEEVIIYYEYEIPIVVTARNEASISSYGTFPKKITDTTIKTVSDARKVAKKIVGVYGNPTTSGTVNVSWDEDVNVGELVQVIDSFNSINQSFVIISSTKTYPAGQKELSLGVEAVDLLSVNKDINDRIKRLEDKQDNSDVIQKYMTFNENIKVSIRNGRLRVRTRDISGDIMIWDNLDYGDWGTQKWGTIAQLPEYSVKFVSNYNNIMYERFNFTMYDDLSGTTATWNTSGQVCNFLSGQVAQSESVDYANGTIVDATLTPTTVSGTIAYEMTADGTNWQTVLSGVKTTFTNPGTDLRWRATELSGVTAQISQIKITEIH